ncbi:hypothetical protein FH063_001260 [Azospirillum argentinense]|uniref:Uncharacterized protein n=1 Tax=Azospirillum argentinense TaxID=2970906 RepID=A0A5B0L5J7_9PROT|nr:hypothetical protein FH063_001260 [Azospirillum argentinense]
MARAYAEDEGGWPNDDKAERTASALAPNGNRHLFANIPKVLPIFSAFIRTE